jgi:hypothetical protein
MLTADRRKLIEKRRGRRFSISNQQSTIGNRMRVYFPNRFATAAQFTTFHQAPT